MQWLCTLNNRNADKGALPYTILSDLLKRKRCQYFEWNPLYTFFCTYRYKNMIPMRRGGYFYSTKAYNLRDDCYTIESILNWQYNLDCFGEIETYLTLQNIVTCNRWLTLLIIAFNVYLPKNTKKQSGMKKSKHDKQNTQSV